MAGLLTLTLEGSPSVVLPVKITEVGDRQMQNNGIQKCSIEDLYTAWSAPNGSQMVDVREYSEYAAEHIPGTVLTPLSALERYASGLDRQRTTYVMCHWGNRSMQAAKKLAQIGFTDLRVVDGGMLAWAAAELPVERGASMAWSLERQVRFTAGGLVLTGVLLAWLAHPVFLGLAGFIGAGLVFSAVTDTCGMALLLAKMPWNQQPQVLCAPQQQAE